MLAVSRDRHLPGCDHQRARPRVPHRADGARAGDQAALLKAVAGAICPGERLAVGGVPTTAGPQPHYEFRVRCARAAGVATKLDVAGEELELGHIEQAAIGAPVVERRREPKTLLVGESHRYHHPRVAVGDDPASERDRTRPFSLHSSPQARRPPGKAASAQTARQVVPRQTEASARCDRAHAPSSHQRRPTRHRMLTPTRLPGNEQDRAQPRPRAHC